MIEKYEVSLERPDGVSKTKIKKYILESVASCRGGLHPEDPLFDLETRTIKVKSIK